MEKTMKPGYSTFIPGLLLSVMTLNGQDTWYGTVSGMHLMYNPAWSGVAGAPVLNISAYSFLPGNGFALKSVYASCDSYFTDLHGGAGIWISDDMLGEVMNDLRVGGSYAYHFRAGKDLYITAGLSVALISRGIRTGSIILPGDIDPLRGITGGSSGYTSPENFSRFDMGTGVSLSSGQWYGGLSVMHLTQPYLGDDQLEHNRLKRLYTITAGGTFAPGRSGLILRPSASLLAQGEDVTACLGTELLFRGLMSGLAVWHVSGGFTAAQTSLGWDADPVRFILSYSYILAGGDVSFKGTAIVKAGLVFSFNNVEKRRVVHIIKLPVL
ncbi:type IX secretion system membrane protein PorP/SprF [bacterium]|nr:type IX secretion system membrane protein PorP/SprF [bacterium]